MRKIGALMILAAGVAAAETTIGSLTFTNTPLTVLPEGASEPAIAIRNDGALAVTGLQWLFFPDLPFGTHLWTGQFGATPAFRGVIDTNLPRPGKLQYGAGDADIDFGSTGALHATTLVLLFDPVYGIFGFNPGASRQFTYGVSAVTCPSLSDFSNCKSQLIDAVETDRPWIGSAGSHVYISYRDALSSLIRVWRSDDDGITWKRAADPIVGQGEATAVASWNSILGPIVADPSTGNVYQIYTSGDTGLSKSSCCFLNNIFVARSTDMGEHWTTQLVYHAPLFTALDNNFASLTADPASGILYTVWSDDHQVFFSSSTDQGINWLPPVAVNIAPATTAIMPSVAARNGRASVVYYATNSALKDDPSAAWNVYIAQTTDNGSSFQQSKISISPNHSNLSGFICTEGDRVPCRDYFRGKTLLDLFEVAINPIDGKVAVAYVDDTLMTWSSSSGVFALPQVVLAQQQ